MAPIVSLVSFCFLFSFGARSSGEERSRLRRGRKTGRIGSGKKGPRGCYKLAWDDDAARTKPRLGASVTFGETSYRPSVPASKGLQLGFFNRSFSSVEIKDNGS